MASYNRLEDKISAKKAKICVIGLGYVGLPLAVEFAKKGFFVFGYDTNSKRINYLRKKKRYITDIDADVPYRLIKEGRFLPANKVKVIQDSDIIIICVPTPLRKVKTPDISYIINASHTIRNNIKRGTLVVLESTTYPGTSREVILPILSKSGLTCGKDFFLSFSPERVDPGNRQYPLNKIPKVVGGLDNKSTRLTKILYSKIIKKIVPVSSIETAETVKLLENSFRLINIGLINEFALVCNKLGISVWETISAAGSKPFGFMPFYPGPGCGGHCIPADPIYLSWRGKKLGFKTDMIDLASFINHFMPKYVVKRVQQLVKESNKPVQEAKILILGVTYKKDVKDLRESPALDIIEQLQKKKVKVNYYDPLIPYIKVPPINLKRAGLSKTSLNKYDCVVIVTAHTKVNYKLIQQNAKLIFDTRNVYKRQYKKVVRL